MLCSAQQFESNFQQWRNYFKVFEKRRKLPSQEKVRPTTHRFGRTPRFPSIFSEIKGHTQLFKSKVKRWIQPASPENALSEGYLSTISSKTPHALLVSLRLTAWTLTFLPPSMPLPDSFQSTSCRKHPSSNCRIIARSLSVLGGLALSLRQPQCRFATGEDTLGVIVKQQNQHHSRRVRRTPATFIRRLYRAGIRLLHNLYQKRAGLFHPTNPRGSQSS